ncbi:MAG: hypothetical protein ABEJ07_05605 [Candidatus Nanohaloarchaea archaeon]
MDIVEEIDRRRNTYAIDEPDRAYSEIRDLLDRRMHFDHVSEEKYFNDVEEKRIRSKIIAMEAFDNVTKEEHEIYITIDGQARELDIQVKSKLITHYPMEGWRNTLWYYAYRALYDKFLYGHVRHGYEPAVEEKLDELLHRIRQNVEANA